MRLGGTRGFLTARIATWNVNSVKQRPAFGDID